MFSERKRMSTAFKIFSIIMLSLVVMYPNSSYADWDGDHHGHDRDRDHSHRSSFNLRFSLWPNSFYYHRPYYYHPNYYRTSYYVQPDYVVVPAVTYQPVVINGITYYLNNGTYYQYTPQGYQVVPTPIVYQPASVLDDEDNSIDTATPVTATTDGYLTVNIPNGHGGYTPVELKRTPKGFVGPQGEFYAQFPTVAQLKLMYGK